MLFTNLRHYLGRFDQLQLLGIVDVLELVFEHHMVGICNSSFAEQPTRRLFHKAIHINICQYFNKFRFKSSLQPNNH